MLMCVAFAFAVAVLATFLATDSILQLCDSVGWWILSESAPGSAQL